MRRITWFTGGWLASARHARSVRPTLEILEDRIAPTANLTGRLVAGTAEPAVQVVNAGALSPAGGPGHPTGFSPGQIRQAYGFNQITFNKGTVPGNGSGQTIAIVDASSQPNIVGDLQTFDSAFGLPAPPRFTVVNQNGGTVQPAADPNWGLEISLDVEWAHAMAPAADILLVEAASNSMSDLLAAVNYARNQPGVSVVSMSWGDSEWSGGSFYDNLFTTPAGHRGVTFVAATGDIGSSGAPPYPSVSPNVLAVGGTQLRTDGAGNYLGETAWADGGGGISTYESQPGYQKGVVSQTSTQRAVPDVAYNASTSSMYAVYDTFSYGGWIQAYGTSVGTPQWAALIAIANQGRALAGRSSLDGPTQTLPALYQIPKGDFHDITGGSNGAYSAGPGYDLVTGRGSPRANLVVAGLVGPFEGPPSTGKTTRVVTPPHAAPSPVVDTTTTPKLPGIPARSDPVNPWAAWQRMVDVWMAELTLFESLWVTMFDSWLG